MMNELNISSNLLENFSKNFKGSSVIITGGTRFFGKTLSLALSDSGCKVTAIGTNDFDLRDQNQALDLFSKRFDYCIHAAAVQGGLEFILSHPTKIFLDNLLIHTNVIKACAQFPPKKLISIGSSCAYPGNRSDLKEEEFWDGRLEESVFTYGFTKKTFFVGQYALFKEFQIPGAHLVFNNMYGPHDNFDPDHSHVIAALIAKFFQSKNDQSKVDIWGDGTAEREFLFVDDAVEAILRTLMMVEGFELINIADGQPYKIKELVDALISAFEYDNIHYDASKPTGANLKSLNPKKCQELLQWVPQMKLEDGIQKSVEWYISEHASKL